MVLRLLVLPVFVLRDFGLWDLGLRDLGLRDLGLRVLERVLAMNHLEDFRRINICLSCRDAAPWNQTQSRRNLPVWTGKPGFKPCHCADRDRRDDDFSPDRWGSSWRLRFWGLRAASTLRPSW